jgi:hypothetical protein
MSWLSCLADSVLAVLSWLTCPACPFLAVLSWLFLLAFVVLVNVFCVNCHTAKKLCCAQNIGSQISKLVIVDRLGEAPEKTLDDVRCPLKDVVGLTIRIVAQCERSQIVWFPDR